MDFSRPLLRLPIRFSSDVLAAEVSALPQTAWVAHPMQFNGNSAVRLITEGGEATDVIEGAMAPTPYLRQCPYAMEIMAAIGAVWGRSRLMALAPGAEVPAHIDSHYYWRTHIRIHIPVITNPDVLFTCGDETVHMAAGECWVFDSFQRHEVHNRGTETRVHLVLDTVGGGRLHELIEAAEAGAGTGEVPLSAPQSGAPGELRFEQVNVPTIMSPWEIRCHTQFIADHTPDHPGLKPVLRRLDRFIEEWTATWAQFGEDETASRQYGRLLAEVLADLSRVGAEAIPLSNGVSLQHIFHRLIAEAALKSARRAPPQAQAASRLRRAS